MAGGTLGVILAGGRSSRFGADKALALLQGKPLAAHVAERLGPQVDQMALNTNKDAAAYAVLGLPVFADANGGYEGPLAGALAALAYARERGFEELITAPCDVPALCAGLVSRLRAARGDADCVFAEVNGKMNPVFALYRAGVLPSVQRAFDAGLRAPRDLPKYLPVVMAKFTAQEADAFRDIDTREEFDAYQSDFLPVR
jgi:molybdopterin-guanine dinucleotide biosynthesis protein A